MVKDKRKLKVTFKKLSGQSGTNSGKRDTNFDIESGILETSTSVKRNEDSERNRITNSISTAFFIQIFATLVFFSFESTPF